MLEKRSSRRIDSAVATHLFRIAVEAIDKAVYRSRPKTIEAILDVEGESAVMTIQDDGSGIKYRKDSALRSAFGMIGMSERAQLIGGNVRMQPRAQGRGTTVQVIVPLAKCREVERTAYALSVRGTTSSRDFLSRCRASAGS